MSSGPLQHGEDGGDHDGLAVTQDELQAAAARLRDAATVEAMPVSAKWIDRVVSAATRAADGVTEPLGPGRVAGHSRRLRPPRFLVAAAAMLGIHGLGAAMTAVASGVAVVAATTWLWQSERKSLETMSYAMAAELLGRADQPLEHRRIALLQVVRRIKAVVDLAQSLRADAAPQVQAAASAALVDLRAGIAGTMTAAVPTPLEDLTATWLPQCLDPTQPISLRLDRLMRCIDWAGVALTVVHQIPLGEPGLGEVRCQLLERLATSAELP